MCIKEVNKQVIDYVRRKINSADLSVSANAGRSLQTTYEVMCAWRVGYMSHVPPDVQTFSKGVAANLLAALRQYRGDDSDALPAHVLKTHAARGGNWWWENEHYSCL
jgi:hypothetical protein